MTTPARPARPRRRTALVLAALRAHRRVGPGLFWTWIAMSAATVVLPLATTVLLGRVVGAIPRGRDAVVQALAVLVVVELANAPLQAFRWGIINVLGERYRYAHRERLMRVVLDPPGVDHAYDPEVLDAARNADNVWVVNMLEGIMNVGVMRAVGAGSAVIVAVHVPLAGILLAAAWLATGWWNWRYSTAVAEVLTGRTQHLRRATAVSDLATGPAAAKEIRIFGLSRWLTTRYAAEWWGAMNDVWRRRVEARRGMAGMVAMLFGAHVVALVLIARAALDGDIDVGGLAMVLAAIHLMRELGEGVFGQWEIEFGVPIVAALEAFAEEVSARPDGLTGSAAPPSEHRVIRFEGVRFRYPRAEHDVLDGVDLEIPAGTSVAIVGPNGAGKTTLVQLLARLRDPTAGRISVDDLDLREIDPRAWHERVAAVFQHALRLPLPARDNVAGGRPVDEARLEAAARGAGAMQVIASLPDGWDTPLSRAFSGGTDLSGGQWQRLALARGLYALSCGADVLVLDEPTAHLDVRAEADLYDRFLDLTRGHTTVLVSHRFSTVRRADRIVVLEAGRIVESGTHDELVTRGGRYAEMFAMQAARFREDVDPVPLPEEAV